MTEEEIKKLIAGLKKISCLLDGGNCLPANYNIGYIVGWLQTRFPNIDKKQE